MPVASTAWALPTETDEQPDGGGPFMRVSVYGVYEEDNLAWLYMGATIVGAGPERGIGIDNPPGVEPTVNYGVDGWHLFAPWENDDPLPDSDMTQPSRDVTGMALVDSGAGKAYLAARDDDGDCVCAQGPGTDEGSSIVGGSTTLLRVAYTDVPASLDRIDVVFPRMGGVLADVPITHGPIPKVVDPPAPQLLTPAPGEKAPEVLLPEFRSRNLGSAESTVRRLNLPTATLDRSVTEERDKVVLAADVLFAFDKADLTKKAQSRIHKAATVLRDRAKGTVHVNGYTDSKGSKAYNLRLSNRRARAVRKKLVGMLHGTGLKLVARGFGEADPVTPNTTKDGQDNPQGRALNRRVEIRYTPKPKATATPAPSVTSSLRPRPSGTPTPNDTLARHKAKFGPGSRADEVDTVVEVYRLYQHGGLLTLNFGIHVPRSNPHGDVLGRDALDPLELRYPKYHLNVRGVTLADTKHRRLYIPGEYPGIRDKQECLCSQGMGAGDWDPYPGQTLYLSATYAAPPTGVDTLDVHVPQLSPQTDKPVVLHDIPIEGR
ncbi:MAG: OmpA family protein [Streptosporangiaceae bacterium]